MTELLINEELEQRKTGWRGRMGRRIGERAAEAVASSKRPEFTSPLILELQSGPRLDNQIYMDKQLDSVPVTPIAGMDDIVSLPVGNFISAPNFSDWETGRADGYKYTEDGRRIKSSELIKKYAHRRAETSPPISMVQALRQPNGLVVYKLVGDGGHRLAAAMRRGDEYIQVTNGIDLRQVEENYIPLPSGSETRH